MKKLGKKFESTQVTVIGFKCKSKKQKCATYCNGAACSCSDTGAIMASNDNHIHDTRSSNGSDLNP